MGGGGGGGARRFSLLFIFLGGDWKGGEVSCFPLVC